MHLSVKDCTAYYCSQAGGGGPYFSGVRHQRGYGFFGDLRRYITPLAMKASQYLGKHLLNTGRNVLRDVESGTSLRDSTRNRLRETSSKIKDDFFNKLKQAGSGKKPIKRKRKSKSCQSQAKRSKLSHADIFS